MIMFSVSDKLWLVDFAARFDQGIFLRLSLLPAQVSFGRVLPFVILVSGIELLSWCSKLWCLLGQSARALPLPRLGIFFRPSAFQLLASAQTQHLTQDGMGC